MDWASLKNMDVKDLLVKVKDSQEIFTDKKMLIKFGIIFGSIIIFLMAYYFGFNPKIQAQKKEIANMVKMKKDIKTMITNEKDLKIEIKALEPQFYEKTSLFHTNAEFENFMMTMDDIAKKYGLTVDEILRGERTPEYNSNTAGQNTAGQNTAGQNTAGQNTAGQNTAGQNLGTPSYYILPVTWKITGTYLGYLRYRKEISKTKKYINFDKETIMVQENASPGLILAAGTVSIVQLPN